MFMLRTSRIYFTIAFSLLLAIAMLVISPSLKAQNVDIEEVMSSSGRRSPSRLVVVFRPVPPTFLLSHSKHGKTLLIN